VHEHVCERAQAALHLAKRRAGGGINFIVSLCGEQAADLCTTFRQLVQPLAQDGPRCIRCVEGSVVALV
jgi:hypothetical protein